LSNVEPNLIRFQWCMANPKLSIDAVCIYCDCNVRVTVALRALPAPHKVAAALDTKAARLCPCCLDVIWKDGSPVTHRGTQRRLVREYLHNSDLPATEEFAEKRAALRAHLAELQPRPKP
jgi:hypothetical protein